MTVPWPTHRAKRRAAVQLDNWRKKQGRKNRRAARRKGAVLEPVVPAARGWEGP